MKKMALLEGLAAELAFWLMAYSRTNRSRRSLAYAWGTPDNEDDGYQHTQIGSLSVVELQLPISTIFSGFSRGDSSRQKRLPKRYF